MPQFTNDGSKAVAKIKRRVIDRLFRRGCPKLQLITVLPALVAVKPGRLEIDRKTAATLSFHRMQWAGTINLVAAAIDGHELQQIKNLAHRDLRAQALEIETRHKAPIPAATILAVSRIREEATGT